MERSHKFQPMYMKSLKYAGFVQSLNTKLYIFTNVISGNVICTFIIDLFFERMRNINYKYLSFRCTNASTNHGYHTYYLCEWIELLFVIFLELHHDVMTQKLQIISLPHLGNERDLGYGSWNSLCKRRVVWWHISISAAANCSTRTHIYTHARSHWHIHTYVSATHMHTSSHVHALIQRTCA